MVVTTLERVWRKPEAYRKPRAGRKPMDAVVMFKMLVLGALYTLSDDQIEYQVRDRLSLMRFLGPGLEDRESYPANVAVRWSLCPPSNPGETPTSSPSRNSCTDLHQT